MLRLITNSQLTEIQTILEEIIICKLFSFKDRDSHNQLVIQ